MANIDLIQPEEIYGLFISDEFIRTLKKSGYYTYRTGYESGFRVVRDTNKKFHISNVAKGKTDTVDSDEADFNHGLNEYSETYRFFNFHFHPTPEEPTYPSPEDLLGYNEDDIRSILGVGQIFKNKNIHLILVQNKRKIGRCEFDYFLSELKDSECSTNREVADFFGKSGLYNSEVLPYNYVKESGLYVPQFNREGVTSFSYAVNLDDVLL